MENSRYFESLEAKVKERYCEKLSCVGLSIQDDPYLQKNDARLVNDMAMYLATDTLFRRECLASATKMVVSCCAYGCNNRFGDDKDFVFRAVPRDRKKEWIRAVKRQDSKDSVPRDQFSRNQLPRDQFS